MSQGGNVGKQNVKTGVTLVHQTAGTNLDINFALIG
jgi:hypothetical protein